MCSAVEEMLVIGKEASDQQLDRAAEVLTGHHGVVMFAECVALRRTRTHLLCEVVDPAPSAHRCAQEFEVLVENAQRMLATSRLGQRLPDVPRRWCVVEDAGAGATRLWGAP
jgi:hypothetical protein